MDAIEQSGRHIEFDSQLSTSSRALIAAFGLLPLLAPYELLVRPGWAGDIGPTWWPFLLVSAGAVAVTLLAIYAALFGLSQRVRFDAGRGEIVHGFRAAVLRYREKRYPFRAIERLGLRSHEWSDGPATYNLALKVEGAREIEFGQFTDRVEAERYLAALAQMTRGER